MNIYEVLEYGPIVAADEDYSLLITINGAYLNLWAYDGSEYKCLDCRPPSDDLYTLTVSQAMDQAEAYIQDTLKGEEDEDES